jgi:hypothetical protein
MNKIMKFMYIDKLFMCNLLNCLSKFNSIFKIKHNMNLNELSLCKEFAETSLNLEKYVLLGNNWI